MGTEDIMPNKKDKTRLTGKQRAFVDHYMQSYSPSKAALAAGYETANPAKMGYNIMQSEAVKIAIQEEQDKRKESLSTVPFETVLLMLIETVNDEDLKPNERMKAADLLIKYKSQNKWESADMSQIDKYIDALKSQVGEVWKNDN